VMRIDELQKSIDDWINGHGVRYFDELTNTVLLMEEVGEVARIVARLYGEQSFKTEATVKSRDDLAEELADVMFVLVCLANQLGINLTQALSENLDKKTYRDGERHKQNRKLLDE